MIPLTRLLLAAALAAAAIPAQSRLVIPAGLANREGDSSSWVPAKYAPCRVQFLYGAKAMGASPLRIRSLRLRRDGQRKELFLLHKYDLEIFMSNLSRDPVAGYSRIWADNRGKDFTCVMKKTTVTFPASPPPASAPAPFSIALVLDKPFSYSGKAFLLELVGHAPGFTAYNWYTDAQSSPGWVGAPSGGSRTYSGTGCPPDFFNYGTYPYIGFVWRHYGFCRADRKNLPALDILGTSASSFGSLTLPLDLAPLGAKGCKLYTGPAFVFPSHTDPSSREGRVDFDLGTIPNDPNLVGAVYYEQQAVLDPSFNSFGIRMSRLARCVVGGPFQGSCAFFQFFDFGMGFDLKQVYARYYAPKGLVVELGL